jgi:very-short-patch-repair endonuclease
LEKKTTEEFIKDAIKIHGDTFIYDKTIYVKSNQPVIITCKIHGDFSQRPNNHLNGATCRKCSDENNRLTLDKFKEKSNKKHNNKYDYSLITELPRNHRNTKIKIICPKHGTFEQTPESHLNGHGCNKCKIEGTRNTYKQFLDKAKEIHGDKYEYPNIEEQFIAMDRKIDILCSKHGIFNQSPSHHVNMKQGCPICANDNKCITKKEFIKRSKEKFGDKYDYSLLEENINTSIDIKLICPIHGVIITNADNHLHSKFGCQLCKNENKRLKLSEFLEKAILIHGDKYDYSKVEFNTSQDYIDILCKKHNEYFNLRVTDHINGHNGCPICNESKGERIIRNYLNENNISFKSQQKFKNCFSKYVLPFDFYLEKYNLCIEFDGIQHFKLIKRWGSEENLKDIQIRDKIKDDYCKNNNIKILRINYLDIKNIEKILNDYLCIIKKDELGD